MTTGDLPPEVRDAAVRVAQTRHLLVAMDFDGTMSPLVAHAEDARPLPAAAAAFEALTALEGTTTALVSGRALSSLRVVASPPARALLVGSHGAEVWLGPDSPALSLSPEQERALILARRCVQSAVDAFPGTVAEQKPAGVVLHYRLASAADGQDAVAAVRAELTGASGLFLSDGKMVLEISVIKADKGESLAMLRTVTGATGVVFMGDDVTDEHGFAALNPGDLGIKVGPGETAAMCRIDSPEQVPAVLELLLATRS